MTLRDYHDPSVLRLIGNILWLILAGWYTALTWFLIGLVLCITIIGIPFGVQCFKLGGFSLWPFGRHVEGEPEGRILGVLGNVVWFLLAGLWLAIEYLVAGFLLFITIIGIPFAIQAFKLAHMAVFPFGRRVVREARV